MQKITEKYYDYILYKDNEDYIFSVVCGTIAVFDVTIKLNTQEQKEYQQKGEAFLDTFSSTIRSNPEGFFDRRI
ncbi:hypothetical protein AD998_09775 [bacterium 336/3]|nr:hypothetical protein AD998_09775 [bacterium 336/3]